MFGAGVFSIACSVMQFIDGEWYTHTHNVTLHTYITHTQTHTNISDHLVNPGGKLQLVLALIGKCSIAPCFSIIYAYTPELLPTDVRLV